MRAKLFFVIVFFYLFVLSCKEKYENIVYEGFDYDSAEFLEAELWDTTLLLYGTNMNLLSWDKYLILADFSEGKFVHIYDKLSGELLKNSIYHGRGGDEILQGISAAQITNLGELYLLDGFMSILKVNIESILKDSLITQKIPTVFYEPYNFWTYNMAVINDSLFLLGVIDNGLFDNRPGRLNVVNINKNSTVSTSRFMPLVEWSDSITYDNIQNMYAMHGNIVMSPTKDKFAYAEASAAILEIYSLDNEYNICLDTVRYYTERNLIDGINSSFTGFEDLVATDDYIYATILGPKDKNNKRLHYIGIFDWKGNLCKMYKTKCNIDGMCYDKGANSIYGVAINPDMNENISYAIYRFKLPE